MKILLNINDLKYTKKAVDVLPDIMIEHKKIAERIMGIGCFSADKK